jgi:hypothetical protein
LDVPNFLPIFAVTKDGKPTDMRGLPNIALELIDGNDISSAFL